MANYTTKTIKEIFDGIIAKYTVLRNKYGDKTPLLDKATIKSLGYAFSGTCGVIWQQLLWIYKQCFPQTAELPALKFWGNLIGVDFKEGQTTNLFITLNNVSASYLPTGTIYKDLKTGLISKTVSQAAAENGIIKATAACSTGGPTGNLPIGTILNITNPLDGIPSTATVSEIIIEGTEDEDVEAYRKRVLYKFRNKSQSGSPLDYFTWVTGVKGIVDALIYVLEEGTVTIFPVAEGSGKNRTPSGTLTPNPFPVWVDGQFTELTGSGQLLDIANAIEGSEPGMHDRRPAGAKVDLRLSAVYTPFSVEITGLTDTSYNDSIKQVLINVLDAKKPHIVVLGYSPALAKINKIQLSSACNEIINGETFTSFILKDKNGVSVDESTLGIGGLAYLASLTINGEVINTDE